MYPRQVAVLMQYAALCIFTLSLTSQKMDCVTGVVVRSSMESGVEVKNFFFSETEGPIVDTKRCEAQKSFRHLA